MKPSKFIFYYLLPLLLLTQKIHVNAQEGSPYQTDFISTDESLNENYSLCTDIDGVLITTNRKGILTFDAVEWKLIKTPELPLIVKFNPKSNIVFVGCRNNIGYLKKNKFGDYEYISIAEKDVGNVIQISFAKDYIYFLSPSFLTRINAGDFKDIHYWKGKTGSPFVSLLILKNKTFIDVLGAGLQTPESQGFRPYILNFPLNNKIIFSLPYDENTLLIGASDNKCYLFDGKILKNFQLQDQQYITDGIINGGCILDNNKVIISTIGAGCLVFELKTGKTIFTLNYQTGLPDDEIFALGTDRNHGIWLAHNYGLTRVDAELPVKNFTTFKGLNGNLQALEFKNGKLFIGTSNGVYFLNKKKDYVEYTVKQTNTKVEAKADIKKENTQPTLEQKTPAKESKKGFLGGLFSKKNKGKDNATQAQPEVKEENQKQSIWNIFRKSETAAEKQPLQNKVYRISSVSHFYSKVPGLDHKCKHLFTFNDKLLAVTISGLYEITEDKITPVIPNIEANYVFAVPAEKSVYVCTDKGITIVSQLNNTWKTSNFPLPNSEPVYSFAKDMFDNYWIGSENKVYKAKLKKDGSLKEIKNFLFSSEYRERVIVRISNKKPLFFLSSGVYSIFKDSIQPNVNFTNYIGTNTKYYFTQQEYTWIRNNNKWIHLSANSEPDSIMPSYLSLFDNVNQIYSDNNSNLWIINNNEYIFKVDQKGIADYKSDFSAFIKRFSGISGETFSLYGVELSKSNHSIKIQICAPYFIKPNSNQYQYTIKGLTKDWNEWSSNPEIDLFLPKSGKYEVRFRAKNIFGKISNEKTLTFKIKRAFYETWWFYSLCVLFGLFIIYIIIKFRERNLQREKEILEEKVRERTQQIAEQKEKIETQYNALEIQNEKITNQKEEIEIQRNKIAGQNREIKDSILYAKRIQTAVMPDHTSIGNLLPDYFVLFRPKDIVSGDFYWITKKGNKVIIAAADCTGHGVPGGFLSMLGISLLNEISVIDKNFKANEILNHLKAHLKSTLIKEGHSEEETKDGMDIALCIIDQKNNTLQYSGANNPLYLIRNKELVEYNADKMPIGTFIGEKDSFTNIEIDLQPADIFYLFSDGFKDQLGGPQIKRLKSKNFRNLLLDGHDKPMQKQKELLEQYFDGWRGENEQTDDIMIIGIKI